MSYTITRDKDDTLKIYAVIKNNDTKEWNEFCHALAKYRDKFEPQTTEGKK